MALIIGTTNSLGKCSSTTLTDFELAKKDLENHFNIKKGEKWQNPSFGSNIPFYIFEPIDEIITANIRQEVIDIVEYDPRFELVDDNIVVTEETNSVTVSMNVRYIPLNQVDTLAINFERESLETE